MFRLPFLSCLTVLAIAACSARDPVDDRANNSIGLPDINAAAPSASGEPHVNTTPAKPLPAPAEKIPAALQGRWGLTPADCTTTRGDAKGLLVINGYSLKFYESRAVPTEGAHGDGDSFGGDFAFTGEGQSWTKYQSLKLNKAVLVRTETNPSASFSYAKCG
jgi:hypothetical protein